MNLDVNKQLSPLFQKFLFTNVKCRYRVFKGARNTGKSFSFIGFESLLKILSDRRRNVLIIRQQFSTHRDSTFNEIKKRLENFNLSTPNEEQISISKYFKIDKKTLDIEYLPTGQKIFFKGFDDAEKITSFAVKTGYLTDVYIEEASQVKNFEEFRKLDGSLRGKMPNGLFMQITILLNPWTKHHWLYEELFKGRLEDNINELEAKGFQYYLDEEEIWGFGKGVCLMNSTYLVNAFRDKEVYDQAMLELKQRAYEIWKVEAMGCWGGQGEVTYPEFSPSKHIYPLEDLPKEDIYSLYDFSVGIDTGLGGEKLRADNRYKSATTAQMVGIQRTTNKLYVLDEYFWSNQGKMSEDKKSVVTIANEIHDRLVNFCAKYNITNRLNVYVDNADIGFRDMLIKISIEKSTQYMFAFYGSTKDKIERRVYFERLLFTYNEIFIMPQCKNLIREIQNSQVGERQIIREDFDDHCLNAFEYGWIKLAKTYIYRYKTLTDKF